MEILYTSRSDCIVIVNGEYLHLKERDILVITPGDIHEFNKSTNNSERLLIQFDVTMFDAFEQSNNINHILSYSNRIHFSEGNTVHKMLEDQINKIIKEENDKQPAYVLALNARLYDIIIIAKGLINKDNSIKHNSNLEMLNREINFVPA